MGIPVIRHKEYTNGNVYLSGSMEYAPDGNLGKGWRTMCAERLKQLKFYPLDIAELDSSYTAQHGDLFHSFGADEQHLLQMKSNIRKHFVNTDIELIVKDSDALILYYDEGVRKGAGTISEAQVAYLHDIPVFIVNSYDSLANIPGWLKALSTKIFPSFDELFEYIESLPPGIITRDVYGNHNAGNHYLCSLCGTPFEKHSNHFVSKVSPLYCKSCVEVVRATFESHADRYQFFLDYLTTTDQE